MASNGTYLVHPDTFTNAILVEVAPRMAFGTDQQETDKNGTPKWVAQVAVTFVTPPGMPATPELIAVGIVSATSPADTCQPGGQVTFDGLRLGVTDPAINKNGRVTGGRPWFTAAAIRSAAQASRYSAPKSDAA
jgi:hypothetical protein